MVKLSFGNLYGAIYLKVGKLCKLSGRAHRFRLAKELTQTLLIHNPRHRATVFDALQSDWIMSELVDLDTLYRRKILACK